MMSDVVKILEKLININSCSDREIEEGNEEIINFIINHAKKLDWSFEKQEVKEMDNVYNLILTNGKQGEEHYVLHSHLDTVNPSESFKKPFKLTSKNGKLRGLGSSDMKSGLAIYLSLMKDDYDKKITITLTANEERELYGVKNLIKKEFQEPFKVIISEPTALDLHNSQKGISQLTVKTSGKAAHASKAHLGENAILKMVNVLKRIDSYSKKLDEYNNDYLGHPTLNIGTIKGGGIQANVVPDECSSKIDLRTIPEKETPSIIKDINKITSDDTVVHEDLTYPSVLTPEHNELINDIKEEYKKVLNKELSVSGAGYFTEAYFFADNYDCDFVIFGPGEEDQAHQANEYSYEEKLIQYREIIHNLLK